VEEMIQNIDYAPTFLTAAGLDVPADIHGVPLLGLMRGRHPHDWRRSIYYHYYEFPAVHMVARHYGVRTERYTLAYFYETDEWELFDLETDPHQLTSVYDDPAYAGTVEELKTELGRLRDAYADETGIDFRDR